MGIRLADDANRHPAHEKNRMRTGRRTDGWINGLDVLPEESRSPLQRSVDDVIEPLCAQCKFPIAGHCVHPELAGHLGHHLSLGPQGKSRSHPAVAAVKQKGIRTARPQQFHDGRDMRVAAGWPINRRKVLKELVTVRMRPQRLRHHPEVLAKVLAGQVGRPVGKFTDPHVERGFTNMCGQQLGVRIADVQQAEVAESRRIVHHPRRRFRRAGSAARSRHASGNGEHLEEFPATGHVRTRGRGNPPFKKKLVRDDDQ
jgi:hypothetical protein